MNDDDEIPEALLATDRIVGAPIFNRWGKKLGVVKSFVLDAASGKVRYAVLSSEGFLGPGPDCRPVPFELLERATATEGFVVDFDADALAAGPHYRDGSEPDADRFFWSRVDNYFGVKPATKVRIARPVDLAS